MRLRTPVTLIFQSLVLSWMCVLSMAASAQVDTGALSLAARDQVSVVFSNGTYNRRTGQTSYTATATNIGSETLAGAFYLEIADISVLTVSVVNGSDVNMDGEAVYIARLDSLGPSEQLTYTVIFSSRDRITYTANFYSAPVITETDDDHDGIGNTLDQCPNTASGESVDAGGCSTSQRDSDGDGIPDSIDHDRDNDGVDDDDDVFPDNAAEWSDIDSDGFGDNVDPDRDNDGVANANDAFPNDPAETSDLDGDGIGDNSDPDRDNDGVVNADDLFPDDSTESSDLDGDGKGDSVDEDRDGDGVLNISDAYPDDASRNALPIVTIDTPQTLSTVGASPIDVTGIVDAGAVSFTLNGVSTAIVDGNYAAAVDLSEGHNTVVARMVHADGSVSTASISVSLDLTPPYLTVESHKDGEIVYTDTVSIAGLVNDIVRGTIESDQAVVEVNGVPASIQNRSYLAENIALREGENVLEIVGIDQVGNFSKKQITLRYKPVVGRSLEIVSGQNQSGLIRSELSEPLSIKVLDEYSNPVAQKNVVFRVIQGAGLLTDVDDVGEKAVLIKTNDEGVASVNFSLGQRAGKGNHKVVARVVGYEQELVFYASATQGIGNKLSVNSGNNQRSGVFQPLPAPFVVVVTDLGANAVQGSRVEFGVKQGGGHFQNESDVYVAVTDSDGRATAHLTLGALTGLDRQLVTAKLLDARPGEELTAGFTASGFEVGDPGETTISGIVMDTEDNPLPNVTIRIDGTNRETTSGIDGQFTIENAPVGPVHLIVDGATTTVDGEYPTLSYNIVTVAGVENPLSAPIYMVKLDEASAVYAGATDVILSLSDVPGFKLEIAMGSITFPDGAKEGLVSATVVNSSKIPMAPPNGMQPQFIVTIQPVGAVFDPPARLTLPNVDGHKPGAQVEMFSFDHDLEEFVAIGLGTVSNDGSVIQSNVGVGVVKAGWHCGSQPGGDGCCEGGGGCTDYCSKPSGGCDAGCEIDEGKALESQAQGDCKTATCGGSQDDPSDVPNKGADCKKPGTCEGGEPSDGESDDTDRPEDVPGDCRGQPTCEGGEMNSGEPANDPPADTPNDCKKYECSNGTPNLVDDYGDLPVNNPNDCQKPMCGEGPPEPDLTEVEADQIEGDCAEAMCDGTQVVSSGDAPSDNNMFDCALPVCRGVNAPGLTLATGQKPEDETVDACNLKVYICKGAADPVNGSPSLVSEIEKITGDPLTTDKKCVTCEDGKTINKDGLVKISVKQSISAPAALSGRTKSFLSKFGSPSSSFTGSVDTTVTTCCNELSDGEIWSGSIVAGGSVSVRIKVWPQLPDPEITVSVSVPFGSTYGVKVKTTGGVYAEGSLSATGTVRTTHNDCDSSKSCVSGKVTAGGALTLSAEVSAELCQFETSTDGHTLEECAGAAGVIKVSAGASGVFEASTCNPSNGKLCFDGIKGTMEVSAWLKVDGIKYKGALGVSVGPALKYCTGD